MRRRFYRRPRGRFFRRPKTQWVDGVNWSWVSSIYPAEPVFDANGVIACHTARIPIIPLDQVQREVGDGFTLLRIVGHVWPIVIEESLEQPAWPNSGAQLRYSIERARVYPNISLDDQLVGGGTVGTQQKSHFFGDTQSELGDEDIMFSRQHYQWAQAADTVRLFLNDSANSMLNSNIEGSFGASLYTRQITTTLLGGTTIHDFDVDIRCRRKVMTDSIPFLYVDTTTAIGTPHGAQFVNVQLNGYLRFLVRKSR